MAAHVDIKRYQILSLLYIIFVCFSVLNIKTSTLESNLYTIKSFQKLDEENRKKVDISNVIISNNINQLDTNEKAKAYLNIRTRINQSYNLVVNLVNLINTEFKKNNQTLVSQFNSRNSFEKILRRKDGLEIVRTDLFQLKDYLKASPYKLNTNLENLIPIQEEITNLKGKPQKWDAYLFFHKPTAMGYMQLERIKLLLTQAQLIYQEAALHQIGYEPTYFSKLNPKMYLVSSDIKEVKKDTTTKPIPSTIKPPESKSSPEDDLFKKIVETMHTENLYAGLYNTIFDNFDLEIGKDVDIEIYPKVSVSKIDRKLIANFSKIGEYTLKLTDLRGGNKKVLFERKINANKIPDPIIRVKGDNVNSYTISVKDLLNAERLEAVISINNANTFPGRINSFKIIRIHSGAEDESIINYGELFQSNTQKLLGNLKKNDMVIFDNINISLVDGTTRKPTPILYKIIN